MLFFIVVKIKYILQKLLALHMHTGYCLQDSQRAELGLGNWLPSEFKWQIWTHWYKSLSLEQMLVFTWETVQWHLECWLLPVVPKLSWILNFSKLQSGFWAFLVGQFLWVENIPVVPVNRSSPFSILHGVGFIYQL